MTSSVANIHGANPIRLTIEQFGSSESQTVLETELLVEADSGKYDVAIESLFISSDIPIFPAGTEVFRIIDTTGNNENNVPDFDGVDVSHVCKVGPVYNWLDFAYQIQEFCTQTHDIIEGHLFVEGSLLTQKKIAFRADPDFWGDKYLYFTPEFAEIFQLDKYRAVWVREHQGVVYASNIAGAPVGMFTDYNDLGNPGLFYDAAVSFGFPANFGPYTVLTNSRMDAFENRHKLRIDSVLPLPHELFAVGTKNSSADISHRYTFMELDFPPEILYSKLNIQNSIFSDEKSISQMLLTGCYYLIKPSQAGSLKKLLFGQTQDQRFELFLIRKKIQADGTIDFVTEKYPMQPGDYFRMVLLFTQEV